MIDQFLKLVRIDSVSGEEREIADYLAGELKELGMEVFEDHAGVVLGTGTGNLIASWPGRLEVPAFVLVAHMDTVVPGKGVTPVIKGDAIYSSGDTILGADDKAGIAAILYALRRIRKENISHGPIEVVFTVGEEQGLEGSKSLEKDRVKARIGFVLDSSGEVGTLVVQGPVQNQIEVIVNGKAAHAGINPEDGINAIQVASKAIAGMQLGRIDGETTANIGIIQGGNARNIVPERVYIKGEARSLVAEKLKAQTEHMLERLDSAAREAGAVVEITAEELYPAFQLEAGEPALAIAEEAVRRIGLTPSREKTGGGSDANILNGYGIRTVNLGVAMRQVHTRDEHVFLKDIKLLSDLVYNICLVASEGGR
ncbi:MAG: M20/M25/M40 family metallo-hydrolase [Firmicutes bacterium]|nr:M20/M25/M40 family metallo-hydrolase [Bacillota bacterium]